jgi:streptomycin 6-kinase
MNALSEQLINRYIFIHGENGKAWLKNFVDLRDQLRLRWSLEDPDPISDLKYNYLEYNRESTGRQVVLKIGYPHQELKTEILALEFYNGKRAPKIIDNDPEIGALLLERIVPGYDLRFIENDDAGIQIACQLMKDLWKPHPMNSEFPTTEHWCQGFQRYLDQYPGSRGPLPEDLIQRAQLTTDSLLNDDQEQLLLHGDLHHMNILQAENDSWLAIDPKGVIGEAAFDLAPILFNPIEDLDKTADLVTILKRRINIIKNETGLDIYRVLQWSFVRGVLSAVWEIEDGGDNWEFWIMIAQATAEIIDS